MPEALSDDVFYCTTFFIFSSAPRRVPCRWFCSNSGIHRPKIVHCLDSAGGCYRQLVKGADDIRQDAVMEQACVG